jgi:hypothetical protein
MNFIQIKVQIEKDERLMVQLTRLRSFIISMCMPMRAFSVHSNN